MNDETNQVGLILSAVAFAARKHQHQRRKDREASPYINHPVEVAELCSRIGKVNDPSTLVAALLHDTLEDTKTTPEELKALFGDKILSIVQELSDDKSLPKAERKRLQVEHASHKSVEAKQIKMCDKICNVRDVTLSPPADWSFQRRMEYLDWTEKVMVGLRGANPNLEKYYDETLAAARKKLQEQ